MAVDGIKFSSPSLGEAEIAAVSDVIRSNWIVGGPVLQKLEESFAQQCSVAEGVGVSSWTAGAFLVLRAWGIGPGDEVVVPSYSFIATANVIRHVGAIPVFADIDLNTWNVDPEDIERCITSRTRAILPVDQIGIPCDMDLICDIARRHSLKVLEDAACAIGSCYQGEQVGGLADAAVFSLHARKIVTAGEGGIIVTDDAELGRQLRILRHQGMSKSDFERHGGSSSKFETYDEVGYNFRLTDMQAAIALAQFDRLPQLLEGRRRVSERYQSYFCSHGCIKTVMESPGNEVNWQSFMIGVEENSPMGRNELMQHLDAVGVPSRRGIMAIHREPAYFDYRCSLPHTEWATDHNILLPIHNDLTAEQQDHVIRSIDNILPRG